MASPAHATGGLGVYTSSVAFTEPKPVKTKSPQMKAPNTLLAALALSLCAASAVAQTVTVRDESGKETTAVAEVAESDAAIEPTKPQTARTCLTQTGSRITANRNLRAMREGRAERECANSGGRAYSKDDLEKTGRHDVADALRALDTSIR
jgi:hypothetical protein